jgi:CheY-like chemotaxis protein
MASDSNPGPLKELATSRARFIAELGERVASIRHGLARVGAGPDATGELNAVRRRLHALAAAADVLHFTAAADALRRAEVELASLAGAPSSAPARERVARVLDMVPSLALGAPVDVHEELDGERTRSPREPLCVLVFGDAGLEAALHKPGPLHGAETHATRELDQLLTLVTRLGPDVLVLDGDDARLVEFLPRLRQAAVSNPFPWVAVGSFESYEGMLRLIRRGISRVLPKPVDAASLQRTLRVLVPRELPSPPRPNPLERVGPEGLSDVIAAEARRAFLDPHSGAAHAPAWSAESGNQALAALWSAFARIRVLAGRASEGGARFPLEGPHGMIPLAPTLSEGKTPASHGSPVSEALAGRRFVVADADPTLLGALSRALQRLGASVLPARDGAQALELCERQWPDALLSDALLPQIDGFELCRRVRDDVALGDLPVAVICWKEHLLEHARRVSEQHGSDPRPLDPDAFAPLAEALQKRMALERRLERHDAVHGRIDGLTPRLLLQLACSRMPSALLRVRSGRLSVEVAVVEGRPVHARLLDGTTLAAEGTGALGPFLGMRVGRFSVEPLATAPEAHFSGDVMTVLAPTIARGRRARAWLLSSAPGGIARLELEPRVAAPYAEEAPAAQKSLLARLLRGESPRQLSELSEAIDSAAPALTALLLELVRRGAVLGLVDRNGRDVLEPDPARVSAPARGRGETPAVVLPAALSLAEAVLQAVSSPEQAPEKPSARRTHPGLAPPSPPPEPYHSRRKTPPMPNPRLSAEDRASAVPPEPRPSSAPPERHPSSSPPESRSVTSTQRGPSWVPPEPRSSAVPPERRSSWVPPEPRSSAVPPERRSSWVPPEPRSSAVPPERRSSWIPPEPRPSGIPPERTPSWVPPGSRSSSIIPPEPRPSFVPAERRTSWVPPEPRSPTSSAEGRASWIPPEPRSSERRSVIPSEPRASVIPLPADLDRRASRIPSEPRRSSIPPERRSSWIPSEPRSSSIPPERRPSWIPPEPRSSSIPAEPGGSSTSTERSPSWVPPEPRSSSVPPERASLIPPEPRPTSTNAPTLPPKSRTSPEPREAAEVWSSEPDADEVTDPGPASSGEAIHALDEEQHAAARANTRTLTGPVLVMVAAAGLAFVGVRVIFGGAFDRWAAAPTSETNPLGASPALLHADAGAGGESRSALAPRPVAGRGVGDAGPPPMARTGHTDGTIGVDVSMEPLEPALRSKLFPGLGLLEVRTWEPQRIYVDGVFVGNYDRRLVPLNPGTYNVRLLAGDRGIERSVLVQSGRRTRMSATTSGSE